MGTYKRSRWIVLTVLLAIVFLLSSLAPPVHTQLRKASQLTLSPETFTIASGQSITITAKLTSDGRPLTGRQIVFTASLGSVSPNIVMTNERGEVSVVYTAPVVSVRTSVTITASFLGDSIYEGSTATCQGVVEAEVRLPTVSISGASFAIPETLKDEVSSYRMSIPEDFLKLLPIELPNESFILATSEDLYLVFADKSESGLAYVEGWRLPQSIDIKGINLSIVVAKYVAFEKEGTPTTIGEILSSPDDYKLKLVKVSANRRQISILYDLDEEPHVEFPITIGCLMEKPIKPLNIVKAILEKAKDFALKPDEQLVKDLLQVEGEECLWLFNFNYEYWYEVPAVTNGIVIPTDHLIFELIERSLPVMGRFVRLGGKVILYDVKTDIPYETVSSVKELKTNYDKYVGKVVKLVANCYGGYISVQEVIEENTPCGRDKAYVQDIGCVDIVVDVRLEGLMAWNEVGVPPKSEELLLVSGVSSYHQDEQFVRADGVFELVGKVVSTKQISDSLPEGIALLLCRAKKIGEIDFEKMAQQVKDEVRDRVGELYWALQNIYPYTGQPNIPFKIPRTVFNPVAPIFVRTPEEIPEIYVERNFAISIAVATPEAPVRLRIANSHITEISIVFKEVAKNVTIYFEKLLERPLSVPKPPGLVYAYYKISMNISREVLKEAHITFWVLKKWLVANKATTKDVTMLRYSVGKWEELPTRLIGENATHFKFVAETPEFSMFAIAVHTKTITNISETYRGTVEVNIAQPLKIYPDPDTPFPNTTVVGHPLKISLNVENPNNVTIVGIIVLNFTKSNIKLGDVHVYSDALYKGHPLLINKIIYNDTLVFTIRVAWYNPYFSFEPGLNANVTYFYVLFNEVGKYDWSLAVYVDFILIPPIPPTIPIDITLPTPLPINITPPKFP